MLLLAALLVGLPAAVPGDTALSPLTYLFDTGSTAPQALEAAAVTGRSTWQTLEEDDLTHAFRGDAALANDKLTVVVRRQGSGAEVYARSPAGMKYRVTVAPQSQPAGAPGTLASLRIVENSPSAVALEAAFQSPDGGSRSLQYRLTTGQALLELRAGEAARLIRVAGPAQHAVVPDFFGDDAVLSACGPRRIGLPAENFLLTLADQGAALCMCVWPSGREHAELLAADRLQPGIVGFDVTCANQKDQPVWLALAEGAGLWHECSLDPGPQTVLDWQPPFAAKWRADFITASALARSCYFQNSAGGSDSPAACRLEGPRAVVQRAGPPPAANSGQRLLVYAIDRTPATPLTVISPIDVLRNTLGVGPCQYILQTEGLACETNPTPDSVMTWVEKQFDKKKDRQAADEIRQLLAQMTDHVGQAQRRIEDYAAAVQDIEALVPTQPPAGAEASAAGSPGETLVWLRQVLAAAGDSRPAARSAELAGRVEALVGGANADDECRRLGGEIRAIGLLQDRTLANCRMGLRWLREQARLAAAESSPPAAWTQQVPLRIQEILLPHSSPPR